MKKKWLWIGQRLSDGILYSRALGGLDVFFSCDSLNGQSISFQSDLPKLYSLPADETIPDVQYKWKSKDISKIVEAKNHVKEIRKYLCNGYGIFPYYLSVDSWNRIRGTDCSFNRTNLFNRKVLDNQLTRPMQMDMCNENAVRTPSYVFPHDDMTWNALTSALGDVIVLQFDNTSSGSGTFAIHNESEYRRFCNFYGQADLATEYLEASYSCSAHLWITKDSIVKSPASIQIIERSNHWDNMGIQTFAFKGNDFGFYNQTIGKNTDIDGQLDKIGLMYQKKGIWGLVGVDYIVKDSKFYYTETNFRLQNSTSLLSFIQPQDSGNVVNCLHPSFSKFSDAVSAYQYYASVPAAHLESGYYNRNGDYLGKITAHVPNVEGHFLIFSNMPFDSQQQLRVIGFGIGCEGCGTIKNELKEFLKRLADVYR